jgi:Protein of unknown function (DUF3093)
MAAAGATSGRSGFDERLSVPFWWYLVAAGVGLLLGAEIHMGYPGLRAWLGYAVCVPAFVLALVVLGRARVRVADGQLHVGAAAVPLRHLGRAEIVTADRKREALGPELDPSAFLLLRAWIRPVVRVEITDPDDPTPYWVFSVRDAKGLLTALGR